MIRPKNCDGKSAKGTCMGNPRMDDNPTNQVRVHVQERVTALVRDNDKWGEILTNICYADEHRVHPYGFTFSDIPGLSGFHVNKLVQDRIIEHTHKSSKLTLYQCTIRPAELMEIVAAAVMVPKTDQVVLETAPPLAPERILELQALVDTGADMVDYWANRLQPKIEGLQAVKSALLLSLASPDDTEGDRGRIHVLMYGEPGSGKTELAEWISQHLKVEFCSQRTSRVGLTGDARGAEITPGALPRAHGKTLCVDEGDKFEHKDRQGMLEAMESGVVRIEAGGKSAEFPAMCRIILCANTIEDFSPEFLDRFDFKFYMQSPKGEAEKKVVKSIIKGWFKRKPGYAGDDLRDYLQWVREFTPEISDDVVIGATEVILKYLDLDDDAPAGIRAKESILRVAYTIARINRRNVLVEDFLRAILVLRPHLERGTVKTLELLIDRK